MSDTALLILRNFLLSRYDDLKYRLTRRLGSADLAGDALQDTWLRLESGQEISNVRDPLAYLLRIAVNAAYDQQRGLSRLATESELEAVMEEHPDPQPGPAETLEAKSELAALIAVIERMPVRRRQILIMVRWEHLPQREVAKKLGISLRTVEQELKKAHDYCAACIDRVEK